MAIREGWANVPYIQPRRFKVGIVGSGPAGMACAADMAQAGCEVIVYEAFHEPGGVLKYGIPDFRLPNSVVDVEIEKLTRLGIRFECNTLVGRLFTLEQMLTEMGFHAVFVGTGAGYPSFMGIPGESLNGVLSANEWLTRCNLMHGRDFPSYDTPLQPGKRVAVVGAGNTAMDAMRVSLRVGAEKVYCVYRRSATEAPARAEEIHHAMEEGVEFHWLTSPLELIGDAGNNVRTMRCEKMELGEPDASGRRRPLPVAGSAFELETDTVIFAIGTNANPILGQTSGLKLDKRGYIATDTNLATSISGIYAGGDIVTGAATVIQAMGAGRKAARAMKAYLGVRDSGCVYGREGSGTENMLTRRGRPRSSPLARRWSPARCSEAFVVRQRNGAIPPPARSRWSNRTPTRATIRCAGTINGVAGFAGAGGGGGASASAIAWCSHAAMASPPAWRRWIQSVWNHSGCGAA